MSIVGAPAPLTATEERDLARRVEDGRRARQDLRAPTVGDGGPREALVARVEDADRARERFVAANMGLVKYVVRRDAGAGAEDFDDLVQEGTVALLEALESFDWRRGVRFSTWAVPMIRGRVAEARRLVRGGIRVPVRAARTAAAASTSPVQVTSIHATEGETVWWQAVPEEDPGIEPEDLYDVLGVLPVRHRRVLETRYGLAGGAACTQRETASRLGMAVRTVRRVEQESLQRLRRLLLADVEAAAG